MRGSFGLLRNSNGGIGSSVIGEAAKLVSCSAFSTSSGGGAGGGGGRGRGRGSFAPTVFDFVAGSSKPEEINSNENLNSNERPSPTPFMGRGHGRGQPPPSSPFSPLFNPSGVPGQPPHRQPGVGRGGGVVANEGGSRPTGPVSYRKDDGVETNTFVASNQPPPPQPPLPPQQRQQPGLGRGRGGVANEGESRPTGPMFFTNTFVETNLRPPSPPPPPQQRQQPGVGLGRDGMTNEGESRLTGLMFSRKDGVETNTFVAPDQPPLLQRVGLRRGVVANDGESRPKGPMFSWKADGVESDSVPGQPQNVMTGSGRGLPVRKPALEGRPKDENRHVRARRDGGGRGRDRFDTKEGSAETRNPKLSREEAVQRAVGSLERSDGGRLGGFAGRGMGEGRGRGRGRGREMGMGRGRGRGRGREDDDDDDEFGGLYMGDDADGEKLAKKLGPRVMAELTEAFDDMSSDVLPDLAHDEYVEAYDTNLKFELENEYLFGDFETNPDIHDKPPIPLRDALEKMKPFLVAYEGIADQKEWEEVMDETMEKVPLIKDIVDGFCGPDKVTAKQQQGELERVAKTLPASAPNSVAQFTDRAVRSLQSNAGWGFDRKCQLMDKLVAEFSKSYK